MPDENVSERIPKTPEELERFEECLGDLLPRIPQKWTELDRDDLTAAETRALFLLTAAGFIERRFQLSASMTGQSVTFEFRAWMTGEVGGSEALTPILLRFWSEWAEPYREHRARNPDGSPIQIVQSGPEAWRITEVGETAKADFKKGKMDRSRVVDFVAKAGFFRGRSPVQGSGGSEFLTSPKPQQAPVNANVVNWQDGVTAFLPELLAQLKQAMAQRPVSDLISPDTYPQIWAQLIEFAKNLKGLQQVAMDALLANRGQITRATIETYPDLRVWSRDLNRDESFKSFRTEVNRKFTKAEIAVKIGVADGSGVRLVFAKPAV